MLTESKIREIFFLSSLPRAGAVLAMDIDYVQFAENVERAVEYEKAEAAYRDVISEAKKLNENIGRELEEWAKERLKKYS
jgi:hypothetical protein